LLQSENQENVENKIDPANFSNWQPKLSLENPSFDDLMEVIADFTQHLIGTDGVIEARENFYITMGKSFHSDHTYERRVQYFLDYLIFEHVYKHTQTKESLLPINEFKAHPDSLPARDLLEKIGEPVHSIFSISKVKEKQLWITDIINEVSYVVTPKTNELFTGYKKKMILQCYLFEQGEESWISRGIILHPIDAFKTIVNYVKKSKAQHGFNKNIIISRLARQAMRHQRLPHVGAKTIYGTDPK